MSDTNAIKWLAAQGAEFQTFTYNFTKVGAASAAEAIDRPLEAVCKTLLVEATGRRFHIAIIPGDQRFDAKRMAVALGSKSADLATDGDAERITGYKIGGMSPFALRRKIPIVIEESLLALPAIVVNGGRRGVVVELATEDLIRLLDATPANLCG